ncbi:MAG: thioredoxin family protein [Ignavibacterium sp.]|jgi:thioredoxin-related protein|nr:thioredoxin family protein [Ignavibacterium sp.]
MFSKPLFVFFLLFFLNSFAQDNKSHLKFDPDRDPFEDLKITIKAAEQSDKRIILDVGGEWCIWCHRIDAFMQNTEEVKSLLEENFIILKVNYSKENKNEKFLSQYPPIDGYPHFFMLEKDGALLHSQNTGELEKDKDYSKEKFVEFLNKWKPKKK